MSDPASLVPGSLRRNATWQRLGPSGIPAMVVRPVDAAPPWPLVIWLHGRTAHKELDPGRYLRLMRGGIGVCAVDLPGHGERRDESLLDERRSLDVVLQMESEIDEIVSAIKAVDGVDSNRLAIGGMSAGGMATLRRLCRDHEFMCASVEATSGSWDHQAQRPMFASVDAATISELSPASQLEGWREFPLQVFHSRNDEWMSFAGQEAFLDALRARYDDPTQIELIVYERTGAPYEHVGFGSKSADAKDRQRDFMQRYLLQRPAERPTAS